MNSVLHSVRHHQVLICSQHEMNCVAQLSSPLPTESCVARSHARTCTGFCRRSRFHPSTVLPTRNMPNLYSSTEWLDRLPPWCQSWMSTKSTAKGTQETAFHPVSRPQHATIPCFFPRVRTPCGRCAQVIIGRMETLLIGRGSNPKNNKETHQPNPKNQPQKHKRQRTPTTNVAEFSLY